MKWIHRLDPPPSPDIKELINNMMKPKRSPRAPLLCGSSDHGSSVLSADVDLVAFGVAIDAEPKDLKDFLTGKGLNAVIVEFLTRQELIEERAVRSKTMKVTVKAIDLEKAMNQEIWPMRVGVRYYRAPPYPRG